MKIEIIYMKIHKYIVSCYQCINIGINGFSIIIINAPEIGGNDYQFPSTEKNIFLVFI